MTKKKLRFLVKEIKKNYTNPRADYSQIKKYTNKK